jgi:hypothetical protein
MSEPNCVGRRNSRITLKPVARRALVPGSGTLLLALVVIQVGGGLTVISTGWGLLRQPNDECGPRHRER